MRTIGRACTCGDMQFFVCLKGDKFFVECCDCGAMYEDLSELGDIVGGIHDTTVVMKAVPGVCGAYRLTVGDRQIGGINVRRHRSRRYDLHLDKVYWRRDGEPHIGGSPSRGFRRLKDALAVAQRCVDEKIVKL